MGWDCTACLARLRHASARPLSAHRPKAVGKLTAPSLPPLYLIRRLLCVQTQEAEQQEEGGQG